LFDILNSPFDHRKRKNINKDIFHWLKSYDIKSLNRS